MQAVWKVVQQAQKEAGGGGRKVRGCAVRPAPTVGTGSGAQAPFCNPTERSFVVVKSILCFTAQSLPTTGRKRLMAKGRAWARHLAACSKFCSSGDPAHVSLCESPI